MVTDIDIIFPLGNQWGNQWEINASSKWEINASGSYLQSQVKTTESMAQICMYARVALLYNARAQLKAKYNYLI